MWRIKNRSCVLLLLLALCFLPALCGSSVQAEAMYQISEGELNQLQSNLTELKADSEKKQSLLTEQQKQLAEAQSQLETANRQLEKSRELNKQTQKSLDKANQSLTELEKEAQHKIQIKTRQRNLWISIAAICAAAAIAK